MHQLEKSTLSSVVAVGTNTSYVSACRFSIVSRVSNVSSVSSVKRGAVQGKPSIKNHIVYEKVSYNDAPGVL